MSAQLRVVVSPDAMTASLRIPPDFPREMLSSELVTQCIREAGVLINREVAAKVTALVAAPPPGGSEDEVLIAKGTTPGHGTPALLTWTIDQERADAIKSFYDRTPYITVVPGARLGTLVKETPGADGTNVRGENVRAKPGAHCPVHFRDSIKVEADGSVVSTAGGLLIRSATAAWVGRALEIPGDVDFTSGNIDFDGDITVRGAVKDTFKVKATGSVIIDGPIGATTIECGGDLVARYGVAGGHKGTLSVGGSLVARYLEAVHGLVRGDARVERDLIDCGLVVEGTCNSQTGCMIGGELIVAAEATFKTIGSRASTKTRIVLGSLKSADDTLRNATAELEGVAASLRALQDEHQLLTSRGKSLSPGQRERQTELQFEIYEFTTRREVLRQKIQEAKEAAGTRCRVGLHVTEMLYEGTTVSVHGVDHVIRSDMTGPLRITASNGQAMIAYGNGPSHPLNTMLRRVA